MENHYTYRSATDASPLYQVDITPSEQGGSFLFLQGRKGVTALELKQTLGDALKNSQFLTETFDGKAPILVFRTQADTDALMQTLSTQTGATLKGHSLESKKKKDLLKLRGKIGLLAQFVMMGSARFDPDSTRGAKAKKLTSTINLVSYGMDTAFGTQREADTPRLRFAKKKVNESLKIRFEDAEQSLPKLSETKNSESEQKLRWIDKNSYRLSSSIKLVSKLPMLQPYDKEGKRKDNAVLMSGILTLSAKLTTVLGLPEDPFKTDPDQSLLAKVRRKSNLISSVFDWFSVAALAKGVIYESKPKEQQVKRKWYSLLDLKNQQLRKNGEYQYWLGGAVALFVTGLILKAISPYTNRRIDVENLMDHTSLALANTVKLNHLDEVTQMTQDLMKTRELPEVKEAGFAKTFTQLANRLEMNYQIDLSPREKEIKLAEGKAAGMATKAEAHETALPSTFFADQTSPRSRHFEQTNPQTLLERLQNEPESTTALGSTA